MPFSFCKLIILLSCLLRVSFESKTTFRAENFPYGQFKFQEGSNVTLLCAHVEYTGTHRFLFNSAVLFACTGSTCITVDTFQNSFSFQYEIDRDIENATFKWTLNEIKIQYNQTIVSCYNGLDYHNYIVTIEGRSTNGSQPNLLCIVLLILIIVILILF